MRRGWGEIEASEGSGLISTFNSSYYSDMKRLFMFYLLKNEH